MHSASADGHRDTEHKYMSCVYLIDESCLLDSCTLQERSSTKVKWPLKLDVIKYSSVQVQRLLVIVISMHMHRGDRFYRLAKDNNVSFFIV